MNIIGKWKVKEICMQLFEDKIVYTHDNLPEGDNADEYIMMLNSIIEFTEDGMMNTLLPIPEDQVELAKSQGAVINDEGYAIIESTTWKEADGKYFYDSKTTGTIYDEIEVDPFIEIPFDEEGCITISYGTMKLERV